MIAVFFIGRLAERKMNSRRQSRIVIAKRDITNVLDLIKKDITSAGSTLDKSAEKEAGQAKYLLEKAGKNIDKMGRYLVEGV
jgi:hypothetical protein